MSRDVQLYFEEIVTACDRILEYTHGKSQGEVLETRINRDAVLWNLMTIGEAVKNVPEDVRTQHVGIEWRKIAGLRDVVAHHYPRSTTLCFASSQRCRSHHTGRPELRRDDTHRRSQHWARCGSCR